MKETAAMLAKAGDDFREDASAEAMAAARAYTEAASQFYHSFQRSLDRQVTWTNEDQGTYRRQSAVLRVSRKDFRDKQQLR
jgi:hypothetical protein